MECFTVTLFPAVSCYRRRHQRHRHLPDKMPFSIAPENHCHLRKPSWYLGKIEEPKGEVSDTVP